MTALTKFLPPEYEGVIKYVDIDGRTKLAIRDKISDYIPNPTFGKVAVPGGAAMTSPRAGAGSERAAGFGPRSWWRCRASTRSSTPSRGSSS